MRDEKTPEEYIQEVEERTKFICMFFDRLNDFLGRIGNDHHLPQNASKVNPSCWRNSRFKNLSRERFKKASI